MNTYRIARTAARARIPTSRIIQRRGYADAVSDKIKLTLALPHQSIYKSQDVYVFVKFEDSCPRLAAHN